MMIYHTTFHLSNEVYEKGLDYFRSIYIPAVICDGKLHSPRMQKVLNEDAVVNGVSLSIQFYVENLETLNKWVCEEGESLNKSLVDKFGDEITGFSTLLEEIRLSDE